MPIINLYKKKARPQSGPEGANIGFSVCFGPLWAPLGIYCQRAFAFSLPRRGKSKARRQICFLPKGDVAHTAPLGAGSQRGPGGARPIRYLYKYPLWLSDKEAQRLVLRTLYAAERASLPLRGKSNICPIRLCRIGAFQTKKRPKGRFRPFGGTEMSLSFSLFCLPGGGAVKKLILAALKGRLRKFSFTTNCIKKY